MPLSYPVESHGNVTGRLDPYVGSRDAVYTLPMAGDVEKLAGGVMVGVSLASLPGPAVWSRQIIARIARPTRRSVPEEIGRRCRKPTVIVKANVGVGSWIKRWP